MANYCWINIVGKQKRPVFEAKGFIPLVWIGFGSAIVPGVYRGTKLKQLSRVSSIRRLRGKIDFFDSLFPSISVCDLSEVFFAKLERCRADKILVDLQDVVDKWNRPVLKVAVEAVRSEDPMRSLVIPAETVWNPFTEEQIERPERRYDNTASILYAACHVREEDLRTGPQGLPAEYLFGGIA